MTAHIATINHAFCIPHLSFPPVCLACFLSRSPGGRAERAHYANLILKKGLA
jgi:hypothetical protein